MLLTKKVKTRKIEPGVYAVLIDGRETDLAISKGSAPRYREQQLWNITRRVNGDIFGAFLAGDQRGLFDAVRTIETIINA